MISSPRFIVPLNISLILKGVLTFSTLNILELIGDVLQLCDVFEEFRTNCFETYGLDPAFYFSAPHLSWDAMLKKTGIKLELISDPEMFQMIDSGIRG